VADLDAVDALTAVVTDALVATAVAVVEVVTAGNCMTPVAGTTMAPPLGTNAGVAFVAGGMCSSTAGIGTCTSAWRFLMAMKPAIMQKMIHSAATRTQDRPLLLFICHQVLSSICWLIIILTFCLSFQIAIASELRCIMPTSLAASIYNKHRRRSLPS
jgi:hypothetical protein